MLEQLSTVIIHLIQSTEYVGIFILMTLESALIPIPSEVTMPFAGFLAFKGTLLLPLVILMGAFGNLVGSLIGYAIGYFLEEKVLIMWIKKYGKFILITQKDYDDASAWFIKYGERVVFIGRLLPAVRTFISLPAGVLKMNIWKFSLYTFLGSLLWSAALAYVGFYLGNKWDTIGPFFSKFQIAIFIVILSLVGYFLYHKMKKIQK